MNWSPEQQRLLGAMGYQLLVRVEPPTAPAASSRSFPALRAALTRAAGGADIAALIADLDSLRREPLAKRALWPRLRVLRRSS